MKESFSKIDASKDSSGAVPILKTLLEGVEMTDKQLAEVGNSFYGCYLYFEVIVFKCFVWFHLIPRLSLPL